MTASQLDGPITVMGATGQQGGAVIDVLLQAVPVAVVRPTFFMETLRLMIRRDGAHVTTAMPLAGDVAIQIISVRDAGRAAAAPLLKGEPAVVPVEVAGDELTGEQIAERICQLLRSPTTYAQLPPEVPGRRRGPQADV
jgi:uncharacterized protein YbjT (DUF2867 family)